VRGTPRPTKHSYAGPGSFPRLLEAALAVADAEAESPGDTAFHSACMRLRQAAISYAAQRPPHVLEAARRTGQHGARPADLEVDLITIDRAYDAA
jgi:hypothetical protein